MRSTACARLVAAGQSHRYIAHMLGVGKGTIQREVAQLGLRTAA